jgi:hypothetical protein
MQVSHGSDYGDGDGKIEAREAGVRASVQFLIELEYRAPG